MPRPCAHAHSRLWPQYTVSWIRHRIHHSYSSRLMASASKASTRTPLWTLRKLLITSATEDLFHQQHNMKFQFKHFIKTPQLKKPRVTKFSHINEKNTGECTNAVRNKWQQWSGLPNSECTYLVTQKLQNKPKMSLCKASSEVSGILQSEISGLSQALCKEFCMNLVNYKEKA